MATALFWILLVCVLYSVIALAADVKTKVLYFSCEDESQRIQLSQDELTHATEIDWLQDDITIAQVNLVNSKTEKLWWVKKVDIHSITLPNCKKTVCKILYGKSELHIHYHPSKFIPYLFKKIILCLIEMKTYQIIYRQSNYVQ
ncbi:uncharacterized protein LOC144767527 [Lissotriton helveticus]